MRAPPPFPPTYAYKTSPGVTGMTPSTRPPKPPTPVLPVPPEAPAASTCNHVTPSGTVKVCTSPLELKETSRVKIGVAYR